MKTTIKVELFSNGITIRFNGEDDDIVCLDSSKERDLGKMIWENIESIMSQDDTNQVEVEIEYKPIKGE